jgi:ATP-dependent 26S proteasome regulatory subunit
MLELLNQWDGFDARADVKVILATNRIESLDPALLWPGRIDRKIEFPLPDIKTKRRIFHVIILHPQKFGGCAKCVETNSSCSAFVFVLDGLW